jgi:hypothetical protein
LLLLGRFIIEPIKGPALCLLLALVAGGGRRSFGCVGQISLALRLRLKLGLRFLELLVKLQQLVIVVHVLRIDVAIQTLLVGLARALEAGISQFI